MRQLGVLPNQQQAEKFVDYLLTEGIRTRSEPDDSGFVVWVLGEDDLDRSREEFERFRANPDDTRYADCAAAAAKIRDARVDKIMLAKKNKQSVRFAGGGGQEKLSDRIKRLPVTSGLIAICALVALYTSLGNDLEKTDPLMYVSKRHLYDEEWNPSDPMDASVDVLAGQYWRAFTPALAHGGPLHLIFNMMWLFSLGGQVETRKGVFKYVSMLLGLALFSNLVQVVVWRYPFFLGMSGVVYGLFGYVWIKSRFDPQDRFFMHPQTATMMIIWFFICFMPGMGVANGGHAGGLFLGVVMGFISSRIK